MHESYRHAKSAQSTGLTAGDSTHQALLTIVDEAGSTNSVMTETDRREALPHGYAIMARRQTAGRGQRGNSWESEAGQNVTLSVMLRPEGVEAREQFMVSEAVAIATAGVVAELTGVQAEVKWPNDIYVGQQKIAGILIECGLEGERISRAIAGIGLNVNQSVWRSDAPNPVSMRQLTGEEYDTAATARLLVERVARLTAMLPAGADEIERSYAARLWRREGRHLWEDAASGEVFRAGIARVERTGRLILDNGREYWFKEVKQVIPELP